MALLTPGTPVTVATPQLLVENSFAPGTYRFQLVVFDDAGQASAPATLDVTVVQPVTSVGGGAAGGGPVHVGPVRVGPVHVGPTLPTGPSHIFTPLNTLRNPQ